MFAFQIEQVELEFKVLPKTSIIFSSNKFELSELGTAESDGLNRRYRAGTKNGTRDAGSSQDLLSSLQPIHAYQQCCSL